MSDLGNKISFFLEIMTAERVVLQFAFMDMKQYTTNVQSIRYNTDRKIRQLCSNREGSHWHRPLTTIN
jgi:hypothetical protein